MDPVLSKIFAGVAGASITAAAAYGVVLLRNKFAGLDAAHDNISCGMRQNDTHDVLHSLMENDSNIGSILLSTGEHAHIYINDAEEQGVIHSDHRKKDGQGIKHATFFHNIDKSQSNYIMAQRDLLRPQKIYDRATNPDQDFSDETLSDIKGSKRGAWANNRKRATLDYLLPPKKENSNREMLNQVSGLMLGMLKNLDRWENDEDYISGRDHVAVKYVGDDKKTHFVVMPANKFQNEILDDLITSTDSIKDPKDILRAISNAYNAELGGHDVHSDALNDNVVAMDDASIQEIS